jgi:hypothetical protein
MLPQGQKALLTICLEELVSASFVNCAKQFNKKVHFIVLKHLVFMHPRDKKYNFPIQLTLKQLSMSIQISAFQVYLFY